MKTINFSILVVSLFATQITSANINPYTEHVVGLTCNRGAWNGEGADFNLAFTHSPLAGMEGVTNIDGRKPKKFDASTNNEKQETTLFVTDVRSKNDQVSVLVFKTSDLFQKTEFSAQFYSGEKKYYSAKALVSTVCWANSASPQPIGGHGSDY